MKIKLALAIVVGFTGMISSCAEVEESRMPQMEQMKDSIFARYPTVRAVTVNVVGNNTLIFALGDPDLYKKPATFRDNMGAELGSLAISVMGKDHGMKTGKMIVTPNIRNTDVEPKDGLVTDIILPKD